jgi:hypothetical protein
MILLIARLRGVALVLEVETPKAAEDLEPMIVIVAKKTRLAVVLLQLQFLVLWLLQQSQLVIENEIANAIAPVANLGRPLLPPMILQLAGKEAKDTLGPKWLPQMVVVIMPLGASLHLLVCWTTMKKRPPVLPPTPTEKSWLRP